MSKKPLHQFYLDLIPNLITELFFFLPEKEINNDIIEKFDFFTKYNLFNKVYVLDHHYGPMEYEKDRNHKHIFLKRGKLEQTIFLLLEKKSEVKKHEFHYVLNKYFELVETFLYLTNWMNKNLTKNIETDDTIIGLFYIQFEYFKKHFEELLRNFYPNRETIPKGNFNAHDIIDNYFPDISKSFKPVKSSFLSNLPTKKKIEELNLKNNTETIITIPQKIEKNKKNQLITEEEAEIILLQTFFSTKIKD